MCTCVHAYMYGCTQGGCPCGKPLMRCAFIRSDGRPNRCSVLQRFFCHEKVGFPALFQRITPAPRGIHAWYHMRSRMQHGPVAWLPSGRPPSRPPAGGSPAHHPRRRSVRAALRRLPRRFAPTSPAPGCPHCPPSSHVECMMRVSVCVRWLAVRPFAYYAGSPCALRRHRRLRSLRPPTQPAFEYASNSSLMRLSRGYSIRFRYGFDAVSMRF